MAFIVNAWPESHRMFKHKLAVINYRVFSKYIVVKYEQDDNESSNKCRSMLPFRLYMNHLRLL